MWNRVAMLGSFYMINDVLLQYRLHDEKVSRPENASRQLEVLGRIIRDNFSRYGIEINEVTAREIAVASGSTHYDMTAWPYSRLPVELRNLVLQLDSRFMARHSVSAVQLRSEQARLLAQLSRSLAHAAPAASLRLLLQALWREPGLLTKRRCWAILASTALPRSWIDRIGHQQQGLAAPHSDKYSTNGNL